MKTQGIGRRVGVLGGLAAGLGLVLVCAGMAAGTADARVRSRSGQFVIYGNQLAGPTLGPFSASPTNQLVILEPEPLAVSCERVKEGLLRRFRMQDHWRGKVHVRIRGVRRGLPAVMVDSSRFGDGWQYGVSVAEEVEAGELVRTLVGVLVREMADRYAGRYEPELPLWLVEGLTEEIFAEEGGDVILQRNPLTGRLGANVGQLQWSPKSRRPAEAVRQLRRDLVAVPALTFDQLSLPDRSGWGVAELQHYRRCSQLLVRELLKLPDGPRLLWNMVCVLRQGLNWQTAFLRAYAERFPRLLDAEKWWALVVAEFIGRDGVDAWSVGKSLARLQDALQVPVEVRQDATQPPRRSAVSVAEAVREWELGRQRTALEGVMGRLRLLESCVARETLPLVRSYRACLTGFVERRSRASLSESGKGAGQAETGLLIRDTLRRLAELDESRWALEGQKGPSPSGAMAGS